MAVNPGRRRPKMTKPGDFMPRFDKAPERVARKPTDAEGWKRFKASLYAGLRVKPREDESKE